MATSNSIRVNPLFFWHAPFSSLHFLKKSTHFPEKLDEKVQTTFEFVWKMAFF
ncbi:hypothetical protein [Desulfocicer vacuolatum]|uniref:hypothetical protein n=1 Tax=Desulfocicer vacuolatum TaxID=2298 RepID=UPI001BAFE0CA|nr:hypothetical protein [Desulfocicer vacuolatum]